MRVFADIQAAQDRNSGERGVPRYTAEFATAAAAAKPGLVDQWLLKRGEPIPPSLLGLMSQGPVRYIDEVSRSPDVVHNLAPFQRVGSGLMLGDLLDKRLSGHGTKIVATVYDLIPLVYPHIYFRDAVFRDDYQLASSFVQNADLVLTISDSAARDVVRLLGVDSRKVVAVGTGVPGTFAPARDRSAELADLRRKFPGLRPGFLLYVGGIDFRKNMNGTLLAYSQLERAVRRAHPLVIVCRLVGNSGRQLRRHMNELRINGDVILTDLVDNATLQQLYQTTDLFIFPSLYEGFGLPVVEALRSGAPVVVGDNSSLRDLVPIDSARFDAEDPAAIANTILATLSNEEDRLRTVREVDHSAHRWEAVVENTAAAYHRLTRRHSAPKEGRVAFVTPLPPAATGIAMYNARLVRELSILTSIDVFSQPEAAELAMPRVRQFAYGAFEAMRLLENYREVVIAIGNSFYHLNEFEILRRYGGIVMMHDVRVTGLLHNVKGLRPDLLPPRTYRQLEQLDLEEYRYRRASRRPVDHDQHVQTNSLMSRTITMSADRVLVHSAAGKSIAQLEARRHERHKISQIPFAFVEPSTHRGPDADAITSFGYLSKTKQTPLLCKAFTIAAQSLPETTFAFVGHLSDPTLRRAMDDMVDAAGVSGRVIITDWQSDEQYSGWLARSLLTVQPREHFNGEASAAVAESIGAGIPTIVSDIGWMAELPDDLAVKFPPSTSAETLAAIIVRLARDTDRLNRLSKESLRYASERGFEVVAARLNAIITAEDASRAF